MDETLMKQALLILALLCGVCHAQILPPILQAPPAATVTAAYVKGCTGSNSGATSIACAFTGNVTAGDAIACALQWNDATATFSSLAKSSGSSTVGAFTEPNTVITSGTANADQGYALVTGTGTATITFTASSLVSSAISIMCHDISNIVASSPLDGSASALVNQASPGTGANGVTTGNVTTAVNGDYLFAWTWDVGNNGSGAAGTGYTLRDQINGGRTTESQVQSAAGVVAGTFTATGGGADLWQNGIMALKP